MCSTALIVSMATIPVGCEEVPLALYFQVVDLWTAGYSDIRIINAIINSKESMQLSLSPDTIANIIYNQELMQQGTNMLTVNGHTGSQNSRRLSRIASVDELDDLSVAQMVAQKKEKEKLGLRQLLAKLSA